MSNTTGKNNRFWSGQDQPGSDTNL